MADFNPYAAPEASLKPDVAPENSDCAWRDGVLLVLARHGRLPNRCVQCNEPAVCRTKVTFSFRGILLSSSVTVDVPFCSSHRRKRRTAILLILGLIVIYGGSIALMILTNNQQASGWSIPFWSCLVLSTLIAMAAVDWHVTRLQARQRNATHLWFRGASPQFLDSLPDWPG